MAEFIKLLRDRTKRGGSLDYSACSELIRDLLHILNSKEKGKIKIVGQEEMNRRLVSALILDEHVLLEGLPGVAKTTAVKNLAAEMGLFFNRVQFIPDMQPSDLIGRRDIIPIGDNNFSIEWKDGPLFANLVLADEINRAPSKVQAALLEAMGEKQITPFGMKKRIILHEDAKEYLDFKLSEQSLEKLKEENDPDGNLKDILPKLAGLTKKKYTSQEDFQDNVEEAIGKKQAIRYKSKILKHIEYSHFYYLPDKLKGKGQINFFNKDSFQFSVFATMNPIEIEGTYPLSEAQLDRFCFKTIVNYPAYKDLITIADKVFQTQEGIEKETDSRDETPGKEDFILSFYFLHHCRRVIFEEREGDNSYKHIDNRMIEKISQVVYFSNYKYADDPQAFINDPEQLELQMSFRNEKHKAARKLKGNSIFRYIESGSSPRGVESLIRASLCEAFFDGVPQVKHEHIKRAAYDVLRHRVRLKIQAKTQNITPVDIIEILLDTFLDGESS